MEKVCSSNAGEAQPQKEEISSSSCNSDQTTSFISTCSVAPCCIGKKDQPGSGEVINNEGHNVIPTHVPSEVICDEDKEGSFVPVPSKEISNSEQMPIPVTSSEDNINSEQIMVSTTVPSECTPITKRRRSPRTKRNQIEAETSNKRTKTTPAKKMWKENDAEFMKHLGEDPDHGMVLIFPNEEDKEVVSIIRKLNDELLKRKVQNKFRNWIVKHQPKVEASMLEEDQNPDEEIELESARQIQGGRLEIFLDAPDKSSAAFDTIIGKHLGKDGKKKLLNYCCRQAQKDPRISEKTYDFANFSLLVSLGNCPAQTPHLDLVKPNFQFGLFLEDGTHGTHFVKNVRGLGRVRTPTQLKRLWNKNPTFFDKDYPEGMPEDVFWALNRSEAAVQLLSYFGDTLHPEQTLVENMDCLESVPAGTVSSLPGGVVHAGPASKGMRAIIFFSGAPVGRRTIDPYSADIQYNGCTMAGHLVSMLWRRDGIGPPERCYLLRKLVQYIEATSAKEIDALFADGGKLKEFVQEILKKTYGGMSKDDYIKKQADNREIEFPHDPFSQSNIVVHPDELKLISIDGLYNDFEGEELPVLVYKHKLTKKIIIRFVTPGSDSFSNDDYEGHRSFENIQLIPENDDNEFFFDGTNAKIIGTDGEELIFYKGSRKGQTLTIRDADKNQTTRSWN